MKQDFDAGIKTAETALMKMLRAIFDLSQHVGQAFESLRKHQRAAQQGSSGELKDEGCFQQLAPLLEKNRQFQNPVYQLRALHGALQGDNAQQIQPQVDSLNRSLEKAQQQNRRLTSSMALPSAPSNSTVEPEAGQEDARIPKSRR